LIDRRTDLRKMKKIRENVVGYYSTMKCVRGRSIAVRPSTQTIYNSKRIVFEGQFCHGHVFGDSSFTVIVYDAPEPPPSPQGVALMWVYPCPGFIFSDAEIIDFLGAIFLDACGYLVVFLFRTFPSELAI